MEKRNWKSFEYWKNLYIGSEAELQGRFQSDPMTEKSVFLWTQLGAPLPSGSTSGAWSIFPEIKSLIGFLRFVALPIYFGIWLVREEWDDESNKFINAEQMFETAQSSGKCRFTDDIPLMKELIKNLDNLFDLPDEKIYPELKEVIKKFNDRWENTSTWCFTIQTYENPKDTGMEIFNRIAEDVQEEYQEEEFGMSKGSWIEICNSALNDEKAQLEFKEVLAESALY
jgi:hypothetical protein